MKEITQQDIETVKGELAAKRQEFEQLTFSNLTEKLNWIRNFFNSYTLELEKRYMCKWWEFLPNELRIHFYLYFPEHDLNMANYSHDLEHSLREELRKNRTRCKYLSFEDSFPFYHDD